MVTEISGAGPRYPVVAQAEATAVQRDANLDRAVMASEVGKDEERLSASGPVAGVYARLLDRQDVLNNAAAMLREVDSSMRQAEQALGKMEDDLVALVKIYPPYPIDNPVRISLLNSVGGLRRQIEALSFPPQESFDAVERLLAGQEDKTAKNAEPTQAGDVFSAMREKMWEIPELDPLAAQDAELDKALGQVRSALDAVEQLRQGLWDDVVAAVDAADSPEVRNEGAAAGKLLAELGNLGIGANGSLLQQVAESG